MPSFSAPENHREYVESLARDMMGDLLRYFERRVIQQHEAQDLVSQTLLGLCSNPERVPADDTKARMWCFGIARNVLRNFYTHATRSRELRRRLSHPQFAAVDSAEQAVLLRGEMRTVAAALSALDPEVRECTLLMAADGLGPRQAARRLQINEATARLRFAAGLDQLRQHLAPGQPSD